MTLLRRASLLGAVPGRSLSAPYGASFGGNPPKSARQPPLLSLVSEPGLFFRMPAHAAALRTDSTCVAHADVVPVQRDSINACMGPLSSIG